MHNTFINRYRKSKRRKEYLVNDDEERPLEERAEASDQHPFVGEFEDEEDVFFKMFGDEVKRALEDVPVHFRMVVLLADLQDFQYKEIADIMDCPIGTVMSRLYRGRRILRDKLSSYAEGEGVVSLQDEADDADEADASDDESASDEKTTDLDEYRRKKAAES
jgi:RNA polymerase sigma-70 factor (ECF subfamily)